MALPVTISDVALATAHSYFGPFKSSGGAFYTILLDNTNKNLVEAHKATDPTVSFSEQDGANRPDFVNDPVGSLSVFQDGDLLHVAGQNGGALDDLYYARFDMATDTWVDLDTGAPVDRDILVDAGPGFQSDCDIVVLSTGKIRIVYAGERDKIMGADYGRIHHAHSTDGFNWTAAVAVSDSSAEIDFKGPRIVAPPSNSDQAHIFFLDGTNILQRAISSTDTLRTERDTTFDASLTFAVGHGVGFTRSATSKVRMPYQEVTTNDAESLEFDAFSDDTNPTFTTSKVNDTGTLRSNTGSPIICFAVDGSTVHALLSIESTDDLFSTDDGDSDTWSALVNTFVGTLAHVSCNIYTRGGNIKLAHITKSSGTIRYDEDDLGASVTTFTVTTSLEAAVQKQLTLAASLNASVQTEQQIATTADGAIASLNIATASLEAAVAAAGTAEVNLQAAVKDTIERQSVLDAAMSQDFADTTALDAVLGAPGLVAAGVDAALKAAQEAAASLVAALQAEATSETGLDAGLALVQARQASLQAVIASLVTGQAAIDAAIERGQSTNSVLDSVVQAAIIVAASLDGIIGTAQTLTVSLEAALAAARDVTAGMDSAVAGARLTSMSADAALIELVAISTSVDAALAMARSAVTSLDAAIAQGGSAATSLDAANQVSLALSAGADAAVESAVTRSASLAAALQRALSNVASLDAQLISAGQIVASLDGILQRASLAVAAGVDAALQGVPALSAALDAVLGQIVGPSTVRTFAVPGGRVIIIPPGDRVH